MQSKSKILPIHLHLFIYLVIVVVWNNKNNMLSYNLDENKAAPR